MEYEIVPVPTRILTHRDNICDAILEFAGDKIGKRDVVCAAESVVAITQGRYARSEDFKPGIVAKNICHLFPTYGSLSGWYPMQALIDEEGALRVLMALVAGAFGKLVGKRGVFYMLAGEQAKLIDDVTGTMPPFDKHLVYGPSQPARVAASIAKATGAYGAAIADVNDLKRAAVLGVSEGVDPELVAKILIDNPFGNASQKTPICIIKNYKRD